MVPTSDSSKRIVVMWNLESMRPFVVGEVEKTRHLLASHFRHGNLRLSSCGEIPVVRSESASVGPVGRDIGFTMKHFPSVRLRKMAN